MQHSYEVAGINIVSRLWMWWLPQDATPSALERESGVPGVTQKIIFGNILTILAVFVQGNPPDKSRDSREKVMT